MSWFVLAWCVVSSISQLPRFGLLYASAGSAISVDDEHTGEGNAAPRQSKWHGKPGFKCVHIDGILMTAALTAECARTCCL